MKTYSLSGLLHAAFYCRHIEIARLLKYRNADAENINDDNVTPLFHLFQPGSRNPSAVAQELLDVALPDLVSNINIKSCEGWTALHRAAAFGCSKDIDTLLGLGADVGLKTNELQLLPLATAVQFGNIPTFERLLQHTGIEAVRETDSRGWTMLHLAAEQGNQELIARLVISGADIHATSEASMASTSDNMQPRGLTALDVARSLGAEKLQSFICGLQDGNIDVQIDDEEVFWIAED
jgi:ankyrin repeat protein